MVGEGHGGHGQLHRRQLLDGGMQPEGPADQEHQMAVPPAGAVGHQPGQLLAGPGLSLHAHGDDVSGGRQLAPDGLRFLCQQLGNVRLQVLALRNKALFIGRTALIIQKCFSISALFHIFASYFSIRC